MNDLQLVAFTEMSLKPSIPRDDVAIQFDGHTVRLHAENFNQRGKSVRNGRTTEIALFAVDLKFHEGMRFDVGAAGLMRFLAPREKTATLRMTPRLSRRLVSTLLCAARTSASRCGLPG